MNSYLLAQIVKGGGVGAGKICLPHRIAFFQRQGVQKNAPGNFPAGRLQNKEKAPPRMHSRKAPAPVEGCQALSIRVAA